MGSAVCEKHVIIDCGDKDRDGREVGFRTIPPGLSSVVLSLSRSDDGGYQ